MHSQSTTEHGDGLSRRTVLRRVGLTGVGLAIGAGAVPGVVSAHRVETIAFCGCSQVVVYGEDLDDGQYTAVLYCGDPPDGDTECAPLTGTDGRVNHEVDDGECKIIGVIGTTNPQGDEPGQTFSVCNQYGPQRCAEKALETVASDDLLPCLVDAAATPGTNKLTITETYGGKKAEYEFTASGTVTPTDDIEPSDDPDGDPISGVVRDGSDTYEYEGEITSFTFTEGTTRVLINGEQVNLLCETDLETLGITVRSGGCGPQDPGRPQNPGGPP